MRSRTCRQSAAVSRPPRSDHGSHAVARAEGGFGAAEGTPQRSQASRRRDGFALQLCERTALKGRVIRAISTVLRRTAVRASAAEPPAAVGGHRLSSSRPSTLRAYASHAVARRASASLTGPSVSESESSAIASASSSACASPSDRASHAGEQPDGFAAGGLPLVSHGRVCLSSVPSRFDRPI